MLVFKFYASIEPPIGIEPMTYALQVRRSTSWAKEANCGGSGIRTPVTVTRKAVFKTAAFDRSAKPPFYFHNAKEPQIKKPKSFLRI